MYWRSSSEQDKHGPCSFGALQTGLGIGYVGRGKEGNQEPYKCNRLSSDSAKGIEEIEEDTVTRSGPFLSSGNDFRVV